MNESNLNVKRCKYSTYMENHFITLLIYGKIMAKYFSYLALYLYSYILTLAEKLFMRLTESILKLGMGVSLLKTCLEY